MLTQIVLLVIGLVILLIAAVVAAIGAYYVSKTTLPSSATNLFNGAGTWLVASAIAAFVGVIVILILIITHYVRKDSTLFQSTATHTAIFITFLAALLAAVTAGVAWYKINSIVTIPASAKDGIKASKYAAGTATILAVVASLVLLGAYLLTAFSDPHPIQTAIVVKRKAKVV